MASRDRAAFLLRDQARYCADMGSALYANLLERAAEDAEAGGPVYDVVDAPSFWADALRLMAAVHRSSSPGVLRGSPHTIRSPGARRRATARGRSSAT